MEAADAPRPARQLCRNCLGELPSTPVAASYCPRCGQETALAAPTVMEFARQFGGNYVALRGSLWRTLLALLFRPGHLTLEWLAGRRRRYVLPLRLYISLSVFFFFLLQFSASTPLGTQALQIDAKDKDSGELVIDVTMNNWGWLEPWRPVASARIDSVRQRFQREGAAAFGQRMVLAMITALYYGLFVLIPMLAGVLTLVYRKLGWNYGVHLLFMLHRSSSLLLFMLLLSLSPWGWLSAGLVLWLLVHAERELRRVYGALARSVWRRLLSWCLQTLIALPVLLVILLYAVLA